MAKPHAVGHHHDPHVSVLIPARAILDDNLIQCNAYNYNTVGVMVHTYYTFIYILII